MRSTGLRSANGLTPPRRSASSRPSRSPARDPGGRASPAGRPRGRAPRCRRRMRCMHLHHQPAFGPPAGEVAAAHLDQHLADRIVQHQEQLVVGGGADGAVELEVDLDAGVEVGALVLEPFDGVVDDRDVLGGGALGGQPRGGHLEHPAHLVDLGVVHHAALHEVAHRLADGLGVDGHDSHAAAALDLEQTPGLQPADRLADDGARDAELACPARAPAEARRRASAGSPRSCRGSRR